MGIQIGVNAIQSGIKIPTDGLIFRGVETNNQMGVEYEWDMNVFFSNGFMVIEWDFIVMHWECTLEYDIDIVTKKNI